MFFFFFLSQNKYFMWNLMKIENNEGKLNWFINYLKAFNISSWIPQTTLAVVFNLFIKTLLCIYSNNLILLNYENKF